MERLKDESFLDYSIKACKAREEGRITYQQFGDAILGIENTYSDDYLQRIHSFLKKYLPQIELDIQYATNEEKMLQVLENKKREVIKEQQKMRDQSRELRKLWTSEARFENILDVTEDAINGLPPLKFEYKDFNTSNIKFMEAAVLVSDIHLGLKCDNQFNAYSIDEAMRRLNDLKNKVIYYCSRHNVTKLNFCLLGDLISGIIKTGIRVQQEEDTISQIMLISEALANIIIEMQQFIPEIKIYSVYGNHSRVIPNKSDGIGQENFERLIPFYLRNRLGKNFKVIDGYNDDFLMTTIAGREVFMTHGDKDTPKTAVDNCVRLLGKKPDEIFMAHLHHVSTVDDCDCDIICNGSMCGAEDYSISLRKITKPSQILRIYDEDVIQYKIGLE